MRDAFRLLIIIVRAAALSSSAYWFAGLIAGLILRGEHFLEFITIAGGTILVLLSGVAGGWWISGKLRAAYGRRAARTASFAYAVSALIPLAAAALLADFPDGYASLLWHPLDVASALAGTAVFVTLFSFFPVTLGLWIRHGDSK